MRSNNNFNLVDHTHRRYNPLNGEWILVSPHRGLRPWQGKVEKTTEKIRPQYDPECYLCPGNKRAGGLLNEQYKQTFVFSNDFAALSDNVPEGIIARHKLIQAESESGICKVICFSPRHDLTLAELDNLSIFNVVNLWSKEFEELSTSPDINYIQIFENKGELMGCSNPHPHGQIWAQKSIPSEISKETTHQLKYWETEKRSLLSDYVDLELMDKQRMVLENDHFIVVVPFWAVWPYETMVISKRHIPSIAFMDYSEKKSLASILKDLTSKYDNLFETSFPYSAGMHQSPCDMDHPEWHWHMHFYPPLLRSASIKKYMVGYELLCNPQRDITPEISALTLRNLTIVHYKNKEFNI